MGGEVDLAVELVQSVEDGNGGGDGFVQGGVCWVLDEEVDKRLVVALHKLSQRQLRAGKEDELVWVGGWVGEC